MAYENGLEAKTPYGFALSFFPFTPAVNRAEGRSIRANLKGGADQSHEQERSNRVNESSWT